jgi:hypothetical protein
VFLVICNPVDFEDRKPTFHGANFPWPENLSPTTVIGL